MSGSAQTVHDVDSVEHEAVVEFLAAVICEGLRKAEMVASLSRCLRRDRPKSPVGSFVLADNSSDTDRLSAILLEFGSILRIAQWKQSNLTAHLPEQFPTTAESLQQLREALNDGAERVSTDLTSLQLDTWLREFSWSAPEVIGADVVLTGAPQLDDEFYDRLAVILWDHRHDVTEQPTEEERA